jgi:hypothetical protein
MDDELRSIGVEGYVYLYPLVTMEVTRRQMTNRAGTKPGFAPVGEFGTSANIGRRPVDRALAQGVCPTSGERTAKGRTPPDLRRERCQS